MDENLVINLTLPVWAWAILCVTSMLGLMAATVRSWYEFKTVQFNQKNEELNHKILDKTEELRKFYESRCTKS